MACPFCPGASEVPAEYDVYVLPNRYPSLSPEDDKDLTYGRQEIFLYTSDHKSRLFDQSYDTIEKMLRLIGQSSSRYFEDERIASVLAFEVSGKVFGPSVEHAHGQLFGLSFEPPMFRFASECSDCADAESATERTVADDGHAVIVVPNGSRVPLEMHVVPKRHVGHLFELTDLEYKSLAHMMWRSMWCVREIVRRDYPYFINYRFSPRSQASHLAVEIEPFITLNGTTRHMGGLELGAGVFLNSTSPERSASLLRDALGGINEIIVRKC